MSWWEFSQLSLVHIARSLRAWPKTQEVDNAGDLFRRRDIDGGIKVVWFVFVILLPFLGVFVYLIAEGHKMADRGMEQMQAAKAQQDEHIKSVAGSSVADQITRAKQLLDSGAITQAEFDTMKQKALA